MNAAQAVSTAVQLTSTATLGVFAGAMLTEGLVLVPFWRSLPPDQFFARYAGNHHRLMAFFGPLTWVAGLGELGATATTFWSNHAGPWAMLFAAGATVLAVLTFYIYFGRANLSFLNASLSAKELPNELQRWGSWHTLRTTLSVAAMCGALVAVRTSVE